MRTDQPPPCAAQPDLWDMERGNLSTWLAAIRVCTTDCPLLAQCWADKLATYGPAAGPEGLIQAGVGHTMTGRALRPARLMTYRPDGSEDQDQHSAAMATPVAA